MNYTLIKISDDVFNGIHPNGIEEGYTKHSQIKGELVVGERFVFGSLITSTVKEIVSENDKETIFKTNNSTYKLITNDTRI